MRFFTPLVGVATVLVLLATAPTSAAPGLQHSLSSKSGLEHYIMNPFLTIKLIAHAFANCVDRPIIADGPFVRYEKQAPRTIVACVHKLADTIVHMSRSIRIPKTYRSELSEEMTRDFHRGIYFLYHPKVTMRVEPLDIHPILDTCIPLFHKAMLSLSSLRNDDHLQVNVVKTARAITDVLGTMMVESKKAIARIPEPPNSPTKKHLHERIVKVMNDNTHFAHIWMTEAVNMSFKRYTREDRIAQPGLPYNLRINDALLDYANRHVENYGDF